MVAALVGAALLVALAVTISHGYSHFFDFRNTSQ